MIIPQGTHPGIPVKKKKKKKNNNNNNNKNKTKKILNMYRSKYINMFTVFIYYVLLLLLLLLFTHLDNKLLK